MNRTAANLIAIARAEVGYLEKASNKDLDSKTANKGYANFTKYGQWYGINPGAWCAMFVSWCFGQLAGSRTSAEIMLCDSLWAGCTAMYNRFKSRWRVYSVPQPGDIVVFRQNATSSTMAHTGIVTRVANDRIYTVEGNTSSTEGVVSNGGMVAEKSYSLGYTRIGGYLRPYYEDEKTGTTSQNVTVVLPLLKKGSKGNSVKALQILLNGNGHNCGTVDGDFGTKTDSALKAYQQKKGLVADGECGIKSWTALTGGKP